MFTVGLTAEGYVNPTLQEIRDYVNERIWALVSPTLDLSDRSYEGQLAGIVAEVIKRMCDLGQQNNASIDPDKAVDAALDALCLLTGTLRRGATASVVTLTLTGDPSTAIPTGNGARVTNGPRFDTTDDCNTGSALTSWTTLTAYALGNRVTHGGNAYECIEAGTSGATGPVSVDPLEDETDGSAHWKFLGEGTAAVDVGARATETGPLSANSGTVTEQATSVGGWLGVTNVLDATVGRAQMTNPELRTLRELELAQPGTSPINAIRAALLSLTGVTAVTVFVNNTDSTDGDGMPPHSVEAMVFGGEDQDIWDTLLANVAAGILTHGTEVGSAIDSQGTSHVMKHTRPTEVPIYVRVDIVKDPLVYPADGDDQVRQAIVDWGNQQVAGKNAVSSAIGAHVFEVAGVLELTLCYIKTSPTPTVGTTIAIALREYATYDTSHITVNTTDGVP